MINKLSKISYLDVTDESIHVYRYERKEDEERDQKQVEEYFKNVLLPSPWLDNRAEMMKRVTFSPHPPATLYIHDESHHDISSDMTDDRPTQSRREIGCQTALTLPFDFDLMSLLGKEFFSYVDETVYHACVTTTKESAAASTLRRKLFDQEDKNPDTPTPRKKWEAKGGYEHNTPGYTTSSPTRSSGESSEGPPPSISPYNGISRLNSSNVTESPFFGGSSSSAGCSPIKQASNVGTPVGKRHDISFSSVDVSPISSCEKDPRGREHVNGDSSFYPDVTVGLDATEESVFESSRANRFVSPDISPIGNMPSHVRELTGRKDTMRKLFLYFVLNTV